MELPEGPAGRSFSNEPGDMDLGCPRPRREPSFASGPNLSRCETPLKDIRDCWFDRVGNSRASDTTVKIKNGRPAGKFLLPRKSTCRTTLLHPLRHKTGTKSSAQEGRDEAELVSHAESLSEAAFPMFPEPPLFPRVTQNDVLTAKGGRGVVGVRQMR